MIESNNWIADYIESRVKRGKEWRARLDVHKKLAEEFRYVRILGRGFRAVSIDNANPCGHLRDANNVGIPSRLELQRALEDAMSTSTVSPPPAANKREQRIQASLIRAALQNNLRFDQVLPGLQQHFSELIFITDEFAIKPGNKEVQCRADIVALGRSGNVGSFYPVFVELKIARKLSDLKGQLVNAERLLCQNKEVQRPFKEFLSAVSGVEQARIDCSSGRSKKVLIWPKLPSGKEKSGVEDARKNGFIVVELSDASHSDCRRLHSDYR